MIIFISSLIESRLFFMHKMYQSISRWCHKHILFQRHIKMNDSLNKLHFTPRSNMTWCAVEARLKFDFDWPSVYCTHGSRLFKKKTVFLQSLINGVISIQNFSMNSLLTEYKYKVRTRAHSMYPSAHTWTDALDIKGSSANNTTLRQLLDFTDEDTIKSVVVHSVFINT